MRKSYINKSREGSSFPFGISKDEHKRFHQEWFNTLEDSDKKPALIIIENLFPEIKGAIEFHEILLIYEKGRRVQNARIHANREMFRRYFRLEIENDDYSINELNNFFTRPIRANALTDMLETYSLEVDELTKISKAGSFLNQLERVVDESQITISHDNIREIIRSFFDIADKLMLKSDVHPRLVGNVNNSTIIYTVFRNLLMRLDKADGIELVREGFQKGNSISFMSEILAGSEKNTKQENSSPPFFSPMINIEDISELKLLFIKKIEDMTMINYSNEKFNYDIFTRPSIDLLLHKCEQNFEEKKLSKYVNAFMENERALIDAIILSFKYERGLSINTIDRYISKEKQKGIIQNIIVTRSDLTETEIDLLKNFIETRMDIGFD